MADLTSDDINNLRDSLETLNKSILKMGSGNARSGATGSSSAPTRKSPQDRMQDQEQKKSLKYLKDTNKESKKYQDSLKDITKDLSKVEKEFESLHNGLTDLAKLLSVSGAFGVVTKHIGKSIDTYREMVSVGEDFNGSMLKMQIAAAEARVPLEEFSRMVKKSSLAIAATGVPAFTALGKSLRSNLQQFGMLGMTTTQLNDFLGDYMETQRQYGLLSKMNSSEASDSMQRLAIETQKMTNLTGKSREEIMKATQGALRDDSVRSLMWLQQGNASKGMVDSLNKASVYLAGMPGQAGDLMSKMLAQAVGKGSAYLADDMQVFTNAGMSNVVGMFEEVRKKVASGTLTDADMESFRKNFVGEVQRSGQSLKNLADYANDPDAKKILGMAQEMSNLSEKQLKELTAQKKVTNFFLTLQDTLQRVSGFLREKFFKGLESAGLVIEKWVESPAFKTFQDKLGEMAERFGVWIAGVFSEDNMNKLANNIEPFFNGLVSAASGLVSFASAVGSVVGGLISAFGKLSDYVGGPLNAALIAFGAILIAKAAAAKIGAHMSEKFDIPGKSSFRYKNGALLVHVVNQGQSGQGGSASDFLDNSHEHRENRERSRRTSERSSRGTRGGRGRLARVGDHMSRGANSARNGMSRVGDVMGRGASHVRTGAGRATSAVGRAGRAVVRGARTAGPAIARGARAAGRGISRAGGALAKGAKGVMKAGGGLGGGLVGMGLGMATDAMNAGGPFKGSGALNLASGLAQGAMMGAAFGPIGAAVGAAIGGAQAAWEHWDELTSDITGAISWIGDTFTKGMSWLTDGISSIGKKIMGTIKDSAIVQAGMQVFDFTTGALTDTFEGLATGWNAFKDGLSSLWDKAPKSLSDVGNLIVDGATAYVGLYQKAGQFVMDGLSKGWDMYWQASGAVFDKGVELAKMAGDNYIKAHPKTVAAVTAAYNWVADKMPDSVKEIGSGIVDQLQKGGQIVSALAHGDFSKAWDLYSSNIVKTFSWVADMIPGPLKDIGRGVAENFKTAGDAVTALFNGDFSKAWDLASGLVMKGVNSYVDGIKSEISNFTQFFSDAWTGITNFDFGSVLDDVGKAIDGVKSYINGIFDKLGGWLNDMFGWIGNLFSGNSVITKLVSASPIGQALVSATKAVSAPTSVATPETPAVNTDEMENHLKSLVDQTAANNAATETMKSSFQKMLDVMGEQLQVSKIGLGGLIDETKKGNRDIGNALK